MSDTRFKKGIHYSIATEFKKGMVPRHKKIPASIICKFCHTGFLVPQYRKHTAKFCSRSCRAKHNLSGEKHPMWKGGKPKCMKCGISLSNYSNKNCNSCKGMRGSENPRWIIDRTKVVGRHNRNLHDSDYKQWVMNVRNRDGWKCKISNGDCSGRLETHHILGWKDYPALRYQINNGITLCHAHHPRKRAEEKRLIPMFLELVSVSSKPVSLP